MLETYQNTTITKTCPIPVKIIDLVDSILKFLLAKWRDTRRKIAHTHAELYNTHITFDLNSLIYLSYDDIAVIDDAMMCIGNILHSQFIPVTKRQCPLHETQTLKHGSITPAHRHYTNTNTDNVFHQYAIAYTVESSLQFVIVRLNKHDKTFTVTMLCE